MLGTSRLGGATGALAAAMLLGCQAEGPADGAVARNQPDSAMVTAPGANLDPATSSWPARQRLAWGEDPAGLRLRRPGLEQVAEGPGAVGVGLDGAPLLLDRLVGRIVRVAADGSLRTVAQVPVDCEDLAVGPDGAIAAFSPLRATAWLFEPDGRPGGEVAVPRVLYEATGVALAAGRQLWVRTGYQELFALGSPAAPAPLPTVLLGKREGAALLGDGRGVVALLRDGRAVLALVAQPAGTSRATVTASHAIDGPASAARVVGVTAEAACLRVEHLRTPSAALPAAQPVAVDRRVVCLDLGSGRTLLDEPLAPPGLYLPRRELGLGPNGVVYHILPTADGLELSRWSFAAPEVR